MHINNMQLLQMTLIILIGLAHYAVDRRYAARHDTPASGGKNWLALGFGGLLLAQPLLWPSGGNLPAGALLALAGAALNLWARHHLAGNYSQQGGARCLSLVDSGPYRFVRHPIFVSYWLSAGAILVANPGWLAAALLGFSLVYFGRAAGADERALRERLPGYGSYQARSKKYIPGVY